MAILEQTNDFPPTGWAVVRPGLGKEVLQSFQASANETRDGNSDSCENTPAKSQGTLFSPPPSLQTVKWKAQETVSKLSVWKY